MLFDDLVGAREHGRRHGEVERLGGDQIDNEVEFGRLLDRKIGFLSTSSAARRQRSGMFAP